MTPADFVSALERASTRHTTSNGTGEVTWHVWGTGYPLVLLHGGTGSWLHWVRNIEDLSRDFMLVVPDIPGSGASSTPIGVSFPVRVEDLAMPLWSGLREIIGADVRFAMAGFSMGGVVSGCIAKLAGSQVDTLVLVGSGGTGGRRAPMDPLVSWRRLPTDADKEAAHRRNLGILMIHDPRKIDDLALYIQIRNALRSRIRGKHLSEGIALAQWLPGFKGRLAGIWGEHDATAAPYLAERRETLRGFQPRAAFDVVPGAGHWVQYETPEPFNRRLRELASPA